MLNTMRRSILPVAIALMMLPGLLSAGGLSTNVGEVVIENLQVGQKYNLNDLANLRLSVYNTSDQTVNLQMDVLSPDQSELRLEAEPVPDLSWITMDQTEFILEAGEQALSEISITIPDDDCFLGRKFEFIVWSHTVPGTAGGMFLACGFKSRVIFTTYEVRADGVYQVQKSQASVNFSIVPEEIRVQEVSTGALYDITEHDGTQLKLTNLGDEPKVFTLSCLPVVKSAVSIADGYADPPEKSRLVFSETEFTLLPGAEKLVSLSVRIPGGEEFRGQKYMFIIRAATDDPGVSAGVYSRLFVSTDGDKD